jgi:hypothetical protein
MHNIGLLTVKAPSHFGANGAHHTRQHTRTAYPTEPTPRSQSRKLVRHVQRLIRYGVLRITLSKRTCRRNSATEMMTAGELGTSMRFTSHEGTLTGLQGVF